MSTVTVVEGGGRALMAAAMLNCIGDIIRVGHLPCRVGTLQSEFANAAHPLSQLVTTNDLQCTNNTYLYYKP